MGLDLVIVKELPKYGRTDYFYEKENEITYIRCNWYRDINFSTSSTYTTRIGKQPNTTDVFPTSESLVRFGKSLIDTVIPPQLVDNKYEYEHLHAIINCLENIKFLDLQETKDSIRNDIDSYCDNLNDILETLDRYRNKITQHMKQNENNEIIKYINLFPTNDIWTIKQMVNFGLKLIEYGNKGYKAYWSY